MDYKFVRWPFNFTWLMRAPFVLTLKEAKGQVQPMLQRTDANNFLIKSAKFKANISLYFSHAFFHQLCTRVDLSKTMVKRTLAA